MKGIISAIVGGERVARGLLCVTCKAASFCTRLAPLGLWSSRALKVLSVEGVKVSHGSFMNIPLLTECSQGGVNLARTH